MKFRFVSQMQLIVLFVGLALIPPYMLFGQKALLEIEKQYQSTRPGSIDRLNHTGKYAQALFFNQQQDDAFKILKENLKFAITFQDQKYAAYLSAILAMNYRIMDQLNEARHYMTQAENFADRTSDREMKGYVDYCKGWLHIRNGQEREAVQSLLHALKWLESAPASESLANRKASVLTELASIYANWKEYDLQEKYSKQALDLAIQQKNPSTLFDAYMMMGYMYEQHYINGGAGLNMRNLAEEHYLKAIDTYRSNESKIPVASNLSFAAINLANLYMRYYPNDYKEKALQYARMAIDKAQQTEQYTQIASAYGIMAEIELRENAPHKAKEHLLMSLSEIAKDPIGDQNIRMNIHLNLSEINENEGNLAEAIRHYKEYIRLFTSLYDAEKMEQGRRLEAQFERERQEQKMLRMQLETEKKEQQITLMHALAVQQKQELQNMRLREDNQRKQLELVNLETEKQAQELKLSRLESQQRARDILNVQNELSYKEKLTKNYGLLAAALFLLILVLGYAYRQRSKAMRQQEELHEFTLEQERQNSKISNLTAMLDGQEQERGRLARDLHDGLGGLLSGTKIQLSQAIERIETPIKRDVQKTLNQLDTAVQELRRVAHNLMPDLLKRYGLEETLTDYALRMSNPDLDVSVQFLHMTNLLSEEQQLIIYRVIQELVNNAVKHADANQILIQLGQEDKKLLVTVEDNGRGFDLQQAKLKKSAGLLNIQSRVNFLKGRMDLQSSPGLGTTVEIEIPMI